MADFNVLASYANQISATSTAGGGTIQQGPAADSTATTAVAANLVLLGIDTVFDSYSQRRTVTEFARSSVEVAAAYALMKVQFLDQLADLNS